MKRLSQTILIITVFLLLLVSAGCHQKQTYAVYSPGDTITDESGNVVATVLNEELNYSTQMDALWMPAKIYKDNGIIFTGTVLRHDEVEIGDGWKYYSMFTVKITGVVADSTDSSLKSGDIVKVSNPISSRRLEQGQSDSLLPANSVECMFFAWKSDDSLYSAFDYMTGDPFSIALKIGDSYAVSGTLGPKPAGTNLLPLSNTTLKELLVSAVGSFKTTANHFVNLYKNSGCELVKANYNDDWATSRMYIISEEALISSINEYMPDNWR
ncbi:MAG: hypothetical protein ACLVML_11545 [Candidatus Gastranaerophilaceae bacterium]|nr:hypothetical protein [Christensenellales bacterium]